MRNFYVSIFLASILLITSCGDGGPSPAPSCTPVTIEIPAGQQYTVDGVTATAGPNGATVTSCVQVHQ